MFLEESEINKLCDLRDDIVKENYDEINQRQFIYGELLGKIILNNNNLFLFIINDYDSGKPMYYYLTDSPSRCYEILRDIDSLDSNEFSYIKDDWNDYFIGECKKKGVYIKRINVGSSYDY